MICSSKLVILAAFFIAVATAAPSLTDKSANTDARSKLPVMEDDVVFVQRRTPHINSGLHDTKPCNSNKTNDSFPAAYIVGHANLWYKKDPTDDTFRETHWVCDKKGGYVKGGMMFDQADKKLYVSECGYYYVSSQVYFQQHTAGIHSRFAHHQLNVQTNCIEGADFIRTNAYANTNTNEFTTTTFTGRLFKICAGGSIYVKIPITTNRACCAYGKRDTFFSAFLVRSFDCSDN